MLEEELKSRELLPLLKNGTEWHQRRAELLNILEENIYGKTPPAPKNVTRNIVWKASITNYAGKVNHERIDVSFDTPSGIFTLPFHLVIPKNAENPPVIMHISFRPTLSEMTEKEYNNIDDRYTPVEEIIDNGFALALVCYQDIVPDTCDGDYSGRMGGMFIKNNKRRPDEWGKIGMWAYGASRVMDYLQTRSDIDTDCISVVGHSRLGKTALWCAAQDERFFAGLSNCSGFGGAAIAKHGTGERVSDFIRAGSCDWFCPRFVSFVGKEDELPYDQHMVIACTAPRFVNVLSAERDRGADPKSEFLSALSAGKVWESAGLKGLEIPDRFPEPGDSLHDGCVGYSIRKGEHAFSRDDWHQHFDFLRKHMPKR